MINYTEALSNAVKNARKEQGLTQTQLALKATIDVRTVINIEKGRGNPKMEVLYALIRTLKIDPRDIFYPELQREDPDVQQLLFQIEECSDEEAIALKPVIQAVLNIIRKR